MSSTPQRHLGIVKQVLSGDTVVIRGHPKGGPPPEKTIVLSNITAPKLGRRVVNTGEETKDEPYAWDAREFLRKKLVGEEVCFVIEKNQNESSKRDYGVIYLGKDPATGENITEAIVSEGWATVRNTSKGGENNRLEELEKAAQAAHKGLWAETGKQVDVEQDLNMVCVTYKGLESDASYFYSWELKETYKPQQHS